MKTFLTVSLVTTLMLLSGCSDSDVKSSGAISSSGDVVEYRLHDGVRCAVFVGSYKGGISCDWDRLSEYQDERETSTHTFYKEE